MNKTPYENWIDITKVIINNLVTETNKLGVQEVSLLTDQEKEILKQFPEMVREEDFTNAVKSLEMTYE